MALDLGDLLGAIPYAQFLGLTIEEHDGRPVFKLTYKPQNIGNATLPALHGGTVGALLESAALLEVLQGEDARALPRTITLTVDYLRSGKPLDTYASAEVTRAGRRVASVRAVAWQDDRDSPIATALVHVLLT